MITWEREGEGGSFKSPVQLFSNFQQSFLEIRLFAPNIAPSLCDLGLCTRGIDRNANGLQSVCLCQDGGGLCQI